MNFAFNSLLTVFFATVVIAKDKVSMCDCGVFKAPHPDKTLDNPVLMKSLVFPIACEVDGRAVCSGICLAAAQAAVETGKKALCDKLVNTTEPFKPLIYTKSCGDSEWINTGAAMDVQVCCSEKLVVDCAESC